ncbi:MAG TPA: hypothetical protein VJY62_21170 [Bacteroidia bacterium]|nr:hypothetical protein [Bacteroidia bacterium]
METTKPYEDGMKTKQKPFDFDLLKKLSSKGIKIKPSLLKLCKRLSVFLSFILIGNALYAQVDLKSFTANFTGTRVKLSWGSVTENNSNYYSVERSPDGKTFQKIGMVKAEGNMQSQTDYSFFDKDYFENVIYYRLKCMDNSGKEKSLAGIIAVQVKEDIKEAAIYPLANVPTRVYVDITKINQTRVIVDATDADGQKLANKQLDKSKNEMAIELKSSYLIQKGDYTLMAFYDNHVIKSKLIIRDPSTNFSEDISKSKPRLFTLK